MDKKQVKALVRKSPIVAPMMFAAYDVPMGGFIARFEKWIKDNPGAPESEMFREALQEHLEAHLDDKKVKAVK